MAAKHSTEKAVLYLRRSTDRQETSIQDQRAELTRYAGDHGYEILREYVDDAISGDRTEDRVGFLTMRDDAADRKFSTVICWDQDRFGRFDILDAGKWIAPFREAGVRLETIAQGRIDWEDLVGQLIYSVNQMGKHQFLRDLGRNTVRGMLSSAKDGRAGTGGRPPFGYRSKGPEVWIVEEEAKIVRLIFRLYLKPGGSLRSVAAELNRRKVPTPSKSRKVKKKSLGLWRMSMVRIILKRRKYTGSFVYLSHAGGKYFSSVDGEIAPRRKCDKVTSNSAPIVHENHFKAIVSQKIFDRVQTKLASEKGITAPKGKAHQYLFSGLLKCADCGGPMGGKMQRDRAIYRCRLYQQTGCSSCYCNSMPEAPLLSVITKKIQDRYLCDSSLDRLRKALRSEQKRTAPKPKDLKRLKSEIENFDRKIDGAEDAVLEAPSRLRPGLYSKLEDLTDQRDRLKTELQALTSHDTRSNGKPDSEVDQAIDVLRDLRDALAKARPQDTKELLSSIVSKIELNYSHAAGDSGRTINTFSHGTIYVRPAIEGSTLLINKGPYCDQECTLIRFTARDLLKAA